MREKHGASSLESIREKLLPSFISFKTARSTQPSGGWGYVGPATSQDGMMERVLLTNRAKLVGILFAQPGSALVKDQVLPNLPYFHERTANNVDFFFAGYSTDGGDADAVRVTTIDSVKWFYSAQALDRMRAEVESSTKWRYSGGCDLLLTNARLDEDRKKVRLGFATSVICPLPEMLRIEAITSVPEFFEEIFRYAEKQDRNDPTWGLGDSPGFDQAGSILKAVVLSLLPKGIGKEAENLVHLAAQDIST
jgi:hypothetical protein